MFNPLNVFQIIDWYEKDKQKHLLLQFAPHLDILEKQQKDIKLTADEKKLLSSVTKLKRKDFDKGVQLFESGKASQAISYY